MANLHAIKPAARAALALLLVLLPLLARPQGVAKPQGAESGASVSKALPPPDEGDQPLCDDAYLNLSNQGCESATLLAYPPIDCTFTYYLHGPNGTVMSGTGELVSFTVTENGSYYLRARNAQGEFISNSVTVTSISKPNTYSVTGGGAFCSGGSAAVGLSGSQSGINYQLRRDGVNVGAAVAGTGSALSFGGQSTSGTYTVSAVSASGCSATMGGSATVTATPAPVTPTVAGAARMGAGPVTLSISSPVLGYTYQWYGSPSGGSPLHTGSSYSPTLSTTTSYYVSARGSEGCESSRRAVTATVHPAPIIAVTAGSTALAPGASVTLSLTQSYSTYQWHRDGVAVPGETGQSLTVSAAGVYSVSVTQAGAAGGATSAGVEVRLARDTQNMNYIVENSVTRAGVQSAADADRLPVGEVVQRITYFDGLGRELQTVQTQASPLKNDIVTPVSYDAFGRVERTYLPYAKGEGGAYRPEALQGARELEAFYSSADASLRDVARTGQPWAVPVYEASPLSRVLEQGAPGEAWQPVPGSTGGKTVKRLERTNATGEARLWRLAADGSWFSLDSHSPGGTSVTFDGVDDFVQVGDRDGLRVANTLTLEAWVNPAGPTNGIIANKEGEYEIALSTDGTLRWAFANASPGWVWVNTAVKVPSNIWSHIAVTYDRGTVRAYLNGVETGAPYSGSGAIGDISPSDNFRIGARQDGGQYFRGAIDEVRVWGTVRTAAEVAADMGTPATGPGLLGFWRLGEGSGTATRDDSGNGHAGTLMGGAAWRLSGFYAPGTLYVTETRDEQGALAVEYKDLQGRVVMKKVQEAEGISETAAEAGFMVTQYLYDDLGNLRLVIQPEGYRRELPAPDGAGRISLTSSFQNRWCFRYAYDGRRRVVEKQVPGAGPVQMVYNRRDEVILTQDANQAAAGKGRWSFSKYDALGRPVVTGIVALPGKGREAIQAEVNLETVHHEEPDLSDGEIGYTLGRAYPRNPDKSGILAVTYYDGYGFLGLAAYAASRPGYAFKAGALAGVSAYNDRVRGQVTGTRTRVLGTDRWLTAVSYYDERYRLIQTVSDGYLGGAVQLASEVTTSLHDFVGRPEKTLVSHQAGTHTVLTSFVYDHMGRALETHQSIDGRAPVLLAKSSYNELGQLTGKRLHSTDYDPKKGEGTFLQSVDYRYNIRGWLTSINDLSLSGGALFGFEVAYNEGLLIGASASDGLFNGNIAETRWATSTDGVKRGFLYSYDGAGRLKGGRYAASASVGAGWTAEAGRYTLDGLTYDANGNIRSLVRRGMTGGSVPDRQAPGRTFGVVDNLAYDYVGNRLVNVRDFAFGPSLQAPWAVDFREGAHTSQVAVEYAYDPNGNLTRDDNKGITEITYNHLNLPERVTMGTTGYISYTYSADGVKLRKEVHHGVWEGQDEVDPGGHEPRDDPEQPETPPEVLSGPGDVAVEPQPRDTDQAEAYMAMASASAPASTWTDYSGLFVHSHEAVFAFTPEGRALHMPDTEEQWRYEYHLKDHLGNLRVSFAEPVTVTNELTMEPMLASVEEQEFDRVEETRHLDRMRARTGSHAALLSAARNKPMGPAKRVELHQGDTLKVKAFGMYETERKKDLAFSLASWLASSAVVSATSGAPGENGGKGKSKGLPYLGAGLAMAPQVLQKEKRAPKAYLRYIVYDADSNYVESGYQSLSGEANKGWEELKLQYAAQQDGFAEVYLANESQEEAWFDDMQVSVAQDMLVQENHYDPWGLNLAGIERQGQPNHKFQYNGKEKQTELGLELISLDFRLYDPQLGRLHAIDPLADKSNNYSPYSFVMNNPILFADPSGLDTLRSNLPEVVVTAARQVSSAISSFNNWYSGQSVGYNGSGWGHGPRRTIANQISLGTTANNLFALGLHSQLQSSKVTLTGGILDKVKNDPAMQKFQSDMVKLLKLDPRFGKVAFVYKDRSVVGFGGSRTGGDGWTNLNLDNPVLQSSTWQVAGNELTWALRNATVSATATVKADGTMVINYSLYDTLDLSGQQGRSGAYNTISNVTGFLYHGVTGGNSSLEVNASWNTTVK